jgi:hypothetical protein
MSKNEFFKKIFKIQIKNTLVWACIVHGQQQNAFENIQNKAE